MQLSVDKLGKVAITVEEDYWSLEKDYDKLTIVEQEGVFGTFISRKPVPAGTVLTNRNYWIPFSRLKEEVVLQFNELVNEVRNLEVSVDEKEAEIYKAIASIVAGGIALKQSFGDSEEFGISQKVITDFKNDYDNLKDLVYEINYEPKFIVSPSVVFKDTPVIVTATASLKFNDVSVSDFASSIPEGWEVGTTSGNTRTFTKDNVNTTQAVSTDISKGNYLKPMTTNITAVDHIYYGAGATDAVLNTDAMVSHGSAITAPSFVQNITTQSGDYLYFEVPSDMRDIQKIELYDNPIFPTELSFVSVETSRLDYKAFKTVANRAAGTHTYKIS